MPYNLQLQKIHKLIKRLQKNKQNLEIVFKNFNLYKENNKPIYR